MTNEHLNDDVVPDSPASGGARSGATAADSADQPRGTGLTGDTMTGDADLNADPDFSAGADYSGDTDLTVDRAAAQPTDWNAEHASNPASGRDANVGDLGDPGHVFDQTNGLVDIGGETDELAQDSTSRADRTDDTDDDAGGPVPFPSSR